VTIATICIHGDGPTADKVVPAVRDALIKAGAVVKPLREWLP
jgi:lactam utilization protein B